MKPAKSMPKALKSLLISSTAAAALVIMPAVTVDFDGFSTDASSAYAKNGGGNGGGGNGGGGNGGGKGGGKGGDKGKSGGSNAGKGSSASASVESDEGDDAEDEVKANQLGKLNASKANINAMNNASSNSTVGAIAEGRATEIANKEVTPGVLDRVAGFLDGVLGIDRDDVEGDDHVADGYDGGLSERYQEEAQEMRDAEAEAESDEGEGSGEET